MKMARVVGTVVSTVKNETMEGKKILLIRSIDRRGREFGKPFLALDSVGAGVGEEVFYARGKEGAFPWHPQPVPSDASIVGILDRYNFTRQDPAAQAAPSSERQGEE
ncbi:MAG TPA: EutN/CcmL family microcompartment protein [Acidobacteriota bacterium]|nr:EutN/CcmL family microcompartment protein [Acidobacteriota bacterium]